MFVYVFAYVVYIRYIQRCAHVCCGLCVPGVFVCTCLYVYLCVFVCACLYVFVRAM